MDISLNKPPSVSYVEIFAWLISLALVGVILGGGLVLLIKSQKPIVTVDPDKVDPNAKYLNPIDIDPNKGVIYKVPEGNETIKVYTGHEKDSPIDGFSRKRKRPAPIVKCTCGKYNCDGVCKPDCNCTNEIKHIHGH